MSGPRTCRGCILSILQQIEKWPSLVSLSVPGAGQCAIHAWEATTHGGLGHITGQAEVRKTLLFIPAENISSFRDAVSPPGPSQLLPEVRTFLLPPASVYKFSLSLSLSSSSSSASNSSGTDTPSRLRYLNTGALLALLSSSQTFTIEENILTAIHLFDSLPVVGEV